MLRDPFVRTGLFLVDINLDQSNPTRQFKQIRVTSPGISVWLALPTDKQCC